MTWIALSSAAVFLALLVYDHWEAGNRELELLRELAALREDNRALMEALARSAGAPALFRKPETETSEGWFDGKPTLVVKQ